MIDKLIFSAINGYMSKTTVFLSGKNEGAWFGMKLVMCKSDRGEGWDNERSVRVE